MLTANLNFLETMRLIHLTHSLPELEYEFLHALLQDAAYASLLKQDRKRLHQVVGETLERLYPERRDELAALLAEHFHQAGDTKRALAYFSLAGDRALSQYALAEAITHFTHAIEIGEQNDSLSPRLYRMRGSAHDTLGDFEQARNDYETAVRMAQHKADQHTEWETLLNLGLLWAGRDYAQTQMYYQRALELARAMNDPITVAHSLNRIGNWYANVEQPSEARIYHQQALSTFRELGDMHSVAETLDLLGIASVLAGDIAQGSGYFQQAVELFRELDDRFGLASSLTSLAGRHTAMTYATPVSSSELVKGMQEAQSDVERALRYAREIGWRAGEAGALSMWALGLIAQGHYTRALDTARAGLALTEMIGHRQWMILGHFALGLLHLDVLAFQQAQQHLEAAHEAAEANKSSYWLLTTTAYLALAYLAQRQMNRAQEILDAVLAPDAPAETVAQRTVWYARAEMALANGDVIQALNIADRLEVFIPETAHSSQVVLYALKLRGDGLVALQRYAEAEVVLNTSRDLLQQAGMRPMLWRILVMLGQAYRGQGKLAEARQAISAACDLIRSLAADAPEHLCSHLMDYAARLSRLSD